MVYTPDGDHYMEELAVSNNDIRAVRAMERPGVVPTGVPAQSVYGFAEVPAGDKLQQLLRDGAVM